MTLIGRLPATSSQKTQVSKSTVGTFAPFPFVLSHNITNILTAVGGRSAFLSGLVLSPKRNPGRGDAGVSKADDQGFGGICDRPAKANSKARPPVPPLWSLRQRGASRCVGDGHFPPGRHQPARLWAPTNLDFPSRVCEALGERRRNESMAASSGFMIAEAERRFPVRIRIGRPTGGARLSARRDQGMARRELRCRGLGDDAIGDTRRAE